MSRTPGIHWAVLLAIGLGTAAAQEPKVKHPNLLLNAEEIGQIKKKIQNQDWAANLFEQVKALADDAVSKGARHPRETALCYALTGDTRYSDAVRRFLVHQGRYSLKQLEKLDVKLQPEHGSWDTWGEYAWAYDLCYHTFSEEERGVVESWLRAGCRYVIAGEKQWTTTPNLVFGKHFNVGLVGFCLGDRELIEWGLNDPGAHGPRKGGFFQVMDAMIKDGHFWGEAPIYALHYDVHGMLALAEAALHYDGTDLYRHVSRKSGASIKSVIDGYVLLGYPLERTGINGGSIRMATFADGSTQYSPRGELLETYLINPADPGRVHAFSGELEIAYKRFKDPGYAWLLSLNPRRDANITYGRAVWGLVGLTHGEPLPEKTSPPKAPGGIYDDQGFALLRADESPAYWTTGGLAAVIMLGKWISHGHLDDYSLILHGKGRLLYPDLNVIQYEPSYLNWTAQGIAHNTLLVDHQSPTHGPFTTRHDLNVEVKHLAITGSAYQDVKQTRAVLLTKEYLADFFHAADTGEPARDRVFDWVLHGLGRLYPGNPGAYRRSDALVPHYWWVDNERGRATDATFQADWIQRSAGVTPGLQAFGPEWFEQEVGVRMTMLGARGTRVYAGDGPFTNGPPYARIDGNPEGSLPMLVVRREVPSTVFAAVHEPYEGRPVIRQVRHLAEDGLATAMMVQAPGFTDYLMTAFDGKAHTLASPNGEVFRFTEYGFLRVEKGAVRARGKLSGFKLPAALLPPTGGLTVNGKQETLRRSDGIVQWGGIPSPPSISTGGSEEDPLEQAASVHARFVPGEVHLSAGAGREIEMHLRGVGNGTTSGHYRILAPNGLSVEPARIPVEALGEGPERIVRFTVRAAGDAPARLQSIRMVPEKGLRAPTETIPVSTGVVITPDNRIPKSGQFVVRAPGYTMKVDHYSGVSFYLLDPDGHRRFGRVTTGNFLTGFPGIAHEGKWSLRFGMPCEGIWTGKQKLTVRPLGVGGAPNARLLYTFHEDHIEMSLVPPTDTTREFTMWLGNFDILEPPVHNGKQDAPHLPIVADRFFFPHPQYRHGVLLTTPPGSPLQFRQTSVSFPIRAGQKVSLRFAEKGETGSGL